MGFFDWFQSVIGQQAEPAKERAPEAANVRVPPEVAKMIVPPDAAKMRVPEKGKVRLSDIDAARADLRFKRVHVGGVSKQNLQSNRYFQSHINTLPTGELEVDLKFQPTGEEFFAIGAFVRGKQVGWLVRWPDPLDEEVQWLSMMNDRGVTPVIYGECIRSNGGSKRIVIYTGGHRWYHELVDYYDNDD